MRLPIPRRLIKKRLLLIIILLLSAIGILYYYKGAAPARELVAIAAGQRDWHDYAAIASDARRIGLGEQGRAAPANWSHKQTQAFGFNALLSDAISLERSLPDKRHKKCRSLSYAAELPAVSIIITYYNEHRSVLLRTVRSLLKRTPAELLHEIILVDDCSDSAQLAATFADYVHQNVSRKVKVLRLEQRTGLMGARMAGARSAEAKLLVFLDAHVEATHNWLPPLLAPIVANPRTCTTPIIDTISYDTFEYIASDATRGGFNWELNYVLLPLSRAQRRQLPAPHNNPVMNGGLFAITAEFFWHLGAYDEGLRIWGAEQFELSIKIWMCGGRLLAVPCSRLAHIFRDPDYSMLYGVERTQLEMQLCVNYKRVAEVWMDEYKNYLYEKVPAMTTVEAGDLSARRALRERLQCKSFQWYLKHVAPDIMRDQLLLEPPETADYAVGALQSVAAPELCVDSSNTHARQLLGALQPCAPDLLRPHYSQNWQLSYRRNLRQHANCLEVQSAYDNAPVWLWHCHNLGGNQFWYYDRHTQMLVHGEGDMKRRCLELNALEKRLYVNACDQSNLNMKWRFGYVNEAAIDEFFKDLDDY